MKNSKALKFVSIEIIQDDMASNPRDEFDNLSTFYGPRESRYSVGGKNDFSLPSYSLPEVIKDLKNSRAVIVPFRSNAGDCFAVIERETIIKEYGNDSRSSLYKARKNAQGEIEQYTAWADGEVYGYKITDNETEEELDSCWGFYGREYCKEEAQSQAKYFEKELSQKAKQVSTRLQIASGL